MCVLLCNIFFSRTFSISCLKAVDVAVGLQAGEKDVEEPQTQEQQTGQEAGHPGAAELSANGGPASEQEHGHADESKNGEEGDGERQWPWIHLEPPPLDFTVDGGHRPGHANPQEHVDSVATGDVSNGCIGMLVLYGGHFASKGVWVRERLEEVTP